MPFTIKSSELNQAAIRTIQERFGDVNLVINVEQNNQDELLSEEDCWELINQLNWEGNPSKSDKQIVSPLIDALVHKSVAHIYQFADWLSKKLWQLDTPLHAENLIKEDGFLSVDDFLYARCAVVANGKEYYNLVLNDPTQFPVSVTFLSLLYLPLDAFQQKTDRKMIYVPLYNYETYGNKEAWAK